MLWPEVHISMQRLQGVPETVDAYHMTAPDPTGPMK